MIGENVKETIQNQNVFLTNMVKAFSVRKPFADFVSPPFQVKLEAGKYLRYTQDIYRIWENKVTGRQKALEIQWEAEEAPYACEEYAMAKFVSNKAKRQSISPIKLEIEASKRLKTYQAQARAYRIAQIAFNQAIITQGVNVASAWNVLAGTPVADILTGMGVIEDAVDEDANAIVIPNQVALKMIQTTEWKNYFQNTEIGFKKGLWNAVAGLRHLGIEPLVTSTKGLSTKKGTSSDPAMEAMASDTVLLFHREVNPTTETMTLMYSPYVFMDIVARTEKKRERGVYLDIYEDTDELLIETGCGYLLRNTL